MTDKRWFKPLLIELLVILAASLAAYTLSQLYEFGYIRFNYPSQDEFAIRGIDVSNHQRDIDWDVVDTNQVRFVFIKATEGGDFKDKRFEQNWEGARRNNIPISAYHFFTFCRKGSEQAQNFIYSVPNEADMLPPAIDLEYSGNCKLTKSRDQLLADIDEFIDTVESYYNRRIIIYVTQSFYRDYLVGRYPNNPLWIRNVFREPRVSDNHPYTFWQYADNGRLKGIPRLVDFNVFSGTANDFKSIIHHRIDPSRD